MVGRTIFELFCKMGVATCSNFNRQWQMLGQEEDEEVEGEVDVE